MGSTLTQINATSNMQRKYTERNETFSIGMDFPITPDRRTMGKFQMSYDLEEGNIDEAELIIMRKFHCWYLIASVGAERDFDEKKWDINYSVQANITALNSLLGNTTNTVLRNGEVPNITGIKF
jgi:hypothetical protein